MWVSEEKLYPGFIWEIHLALTTKVIVRFTFCLLRCSWSRLSTIRSFIFFKMKMNLLPVRWFRQPNVVLQPKYITVTVFVSFYAYCASHQLWFRSPKVWSTCTATWLFREIWVQESGNMYRIREIVNFQSVLVNYRFFCNFNHVSFWSQINVLWLKWQRQKCPKHVRNHGWCDVGQTT